MPVIVLCQYLLACITCGVAADSDGGLDCDCGDCAGEWGATDDLGDPEVDGGPADGGGGSAPGDGAAPADEGNSGGGAGLGGAGDYEEGTEDTETALDDDGQPKLKKGKSTGKRTKKNIVDENLVRPALMKARMAIAQYAGERNEINVHDAVGQMTFGEFMMMMIDKEDVNHHKEKEEAFRLLCSDQTYKDNDYTTLNPGIIIEAQPKAQPKSRDKTTFKEAPYLVLEEGEINKLALAPERPETAHTELEIALEMYADTMKQLVKAAAGNPEVREPSSTKDSKSMDFRQFEYAAKVLHDEWTDEQEELNAEMSSRPENVTREAVIMEASINSLTSPGQTVRTPPAVSGQDQRSQDDGYDGFTQDPQPRANRRTLFLEAEDPAEDGIDIALDAWWGKVVIE